MKLDSQNWASHIIFLLNKTIADLETWFWWVIVIHCFYWGCFLTARTQSPGVEQRPLDFSAEQTILGGLPETQKPQWFLLRGPLTRPSRFLGPGSSMDCYFHATWVGASSQRPGNVGNWLWEAPQKQNLDVLSAHLQTWPGPAVCVCVCFSSLMALRAASHSSHPQSFFPFWVDNGVFVFLAVLFGYNSLFSLLCPPNLYSLS